MVYKHSRIIALFIIATLLFSFVVSQISFGATANDTVQVGVTEAATISISAPANVDLGTITGTGASSAGTATWTVTTNNSAGYKLEWQASSATMASGADTIAAYTPAVANTPDTWTVAAADSEWGGRLKSASDDTETEWGTDTTSEKWLNVDSAAQRQIVDRSTETSASGSNEIVAFKAEVGSNKFQPTGSYTVNVTATATTL